ncbi:hypothetical protein ACLOJK_017007 [Asimina triloba]
MKKYKLKIKLTASKSETSAFDIFQKGGTGQSFSEATEIEANSSATEVEANSSPEEGFLPVTSVTMKRKRGHKTGHKKGKKKWHLVEKEPNINIDDANAEDDSGLDDADDSQLNPVTGTEMPYPEAEKPAIHMPIDMDGQNDRPVGRVKVKLRSRLLEPQHAYSNEPTPSDTDKSNQQIMSETHGEMSEKEDGAYSRPETPATVTSSTTKKAGSIKIKTSRGLSSSGAIMPDKNVNQPISPAETQEERNHVVLENEKNVDSSVSRESDQNITKIAHQDPRYNEKELVASLGVIKEVMKMDASEPFNAPVNPVALGIPVSMCCFAIEKSHWTDAVLDQNSADATCEDDRGKDKSLQEISERKTIIMMPKKEKFPSPIVYRRVNGSGNSQAEDFARSSIGKVKVYKKGGSSKHKTPSSVCLIPQENSPLDNPISEDDGMNLDNLPDFDADDMEEQVDDVKLETPEAENRLQNDKQEISEDETGIPTKGNSESTEKALPSNGTGEEINGQSQANEVESSSHTILPYEQKDEGSTQQKEEGVANHEEDAEQKQGELRKRQKKAKLRDDPLLQENPLILQMCRTLFPGDTKSVWRGPHSLVSRPLSKRASPIHAAVSMFMK